MRVFLLRHAEAVPGSPDALRDLTVRGQGQAAGLGRGAGRLPLLTVRAIEHSPLVRAVRTAQLLRLAAHSSLPLAVRKGLRPEDDPRETAAWLAISRSDRLLVGHNPHLAALAAILLDLRGGGVRFRKAGLMALERTEKPSRSHPYGVWRLLWFVVPEEA